MAVLSQLVCMMMLMYCYTRHQTYAWIARIAGLGELQRRSSPMMLIEAWLRPEPLGSISMHPTMRCCGMHGYNASLCPSPSELPPPAIRLCTFEVIWCGFARTCTLQLCSVLPAGAPASNTAFILIPSTHQYITSCHVL